MIRLLSSDIAARHRLRLPAFGVRKICPNRWSVDLGSSTALIRTPAYHTAGSFRVATSMAETLSFRLLSGKRASPSA